MGNNEDVLNKIQNKITEERIKGKSPKRICLTPEMENEIAAIPASRIGDTLASKITIDGARKVISKLYGLNVEWGSKEFKIED